MNWNSSENWHRRHRGNFWVLPVVLLLLVILTHGWILFLPLMVLAGFAFFGFVLPRIMGHMHEGQWHSGDWSSSDWSARWHEKRKRYFQDWDDQPKRKHDDHIDYV